MPTLLRGAIRWFGGKGKMLRKLLPLMPPCRRYVEPFGGGAAVLIAREPVQVEVYNDLDESLVDFFRVVADPELFGKFYRRAVLLPYSRALFNECRSTWADERNLVKRVVKWFVVARQSFSGTFAMSWSSAVTASRRGRVETANSWQAALERLPVVHARLSRVQIECADWRTIFKRYDTPETLFYCDPPYVHSTRGGGKYAHEMSDDDHVDLVRAVKRLKGSVVLSGYNHEIYAPLNNGRFRRHRFRTACHAALTTRKARTPGNGAANKRQPRTEFVWIKQSKTT